MLSKGTAFAVSSLENFLSIVESSFLLPAGVLEAHVRGGGGGGGAPKCSLSLQSTNSSPEDWSAAEGSIS